MRTRLAAVPLAATLAVASLGGLAACGGGDDGNSDQDPQQVLTAARKALDTTSGVSISMSTDKLPSGITGILSAEGTGVHPSAFEGSFDLSVNGLPAKADVIAVDGKTYAKNSLLLPDWTPIDPADYGAPDPGALMDPDGGFSGLLASATEIKAGKSVRGGADNKEILTQYTGTLPAQAVAALVPTAAGDFDATYTISDDDQLREAVITGAFYGTDKGSVTYDLTLDDYGTTKQISAP